MRSERMGIELKKGNEMEWKRRKGQTIEVEETEKVRKE